MTFDRGASGAKLNPAESGMDTHNGEQLDQIVLGLQMLRRAAGGVSYAEICSRIASRRQSNGVAQPAALVARSTVYDCFRTGRRRLNPDLIAEIVIALGEDESSAERWRMRCIRACHAQEPSALPVRAATPGSTPRSTRPVVPALTGPPGPRLDHTQLRIMRTTLVAVIVIACVGLNIVGGVTNAKFFSPLFLDMIGTAIVAIALGPWHGVIVALGTNIVGTLASNDETLWFGLVNIAGALIWGYGYHRYRMRTPLRFFVLNLLTAFGCTLISMPITIFVFNGSVLHVSATFAENLQAMGHGLLVSFLTANLLVSVADKLIAGYLALLAVRVLAPLQLLERTPSSIA